MIPIFEYLEINRCKNSIYWICLVLVCKNKNVMFLSDNHTTHLIESYHLLIYIEKQIIILKKLKVGF
jgi:hypothetical protein